jgi:hypothetical protein
MKEGTILELNQQNTTTAQNNDAMHASFDDFSAWRDFLGKQVDRAQSVGMSDQQIDDVAFRLGAFLANKVDPKNYQQRLLKQMWDVSSKEDQRALSRIMVDLVDRTNSGANTVH